MKKWKKQATTQHIPRDPPGKTSHSDRLRPRMWFTESPYGATPHVRVYTSLIPSVRDHQINFGIFRDRVGSSRYEREMGFLCLQKPCTVQVYTIYLLQMLWPFLFSGAKGAKKILNWPIKLFARRARASDIWVIQLLSLALGVCES